MPSSAPGAKDREGGRHGGARADFVASLGRKVNDARELVAMLGEDLSSKSTREELRRRLHALGAAARLLRFEAISRSLQEALAVLDRTGPSEVLGERDVGFVAQVLDDLPTLAWAEAPLGVPRPTGGARNGGGPTPVAVLVVGADDLARAFGSDASTGASAFECERTDDVEAAAELARSYAPDVMLVDTDLAGAAALVERLLDDPATDPLPLVVVGTFHSPEESARFVALGAARTLTRPVTLEQIRSTCDEVADRGDGATVRMTLGEPTLEQLAVRLGDELRRALVDSVDPPARTRRIALGEGTEVLGALWGAIARIQQVVTQKTSAAIRFGGEAPEGAIALAPTMHQDLPGADRLAGRGRGAAADVRLHGRCVVVADDDPGVTWFISDLLRTAGCQVHEALDGAVALDLAHRVQPQLVVSDILMPGLDGFALCRALRRDVALRDAPVILLSWKEDLLQRVRELGASAAAYLRKESGSRAILARVREVLRPRARIEERIAQAGEVRGRLDGLTPRVLLELVCSIRTDARLAVRDAMHLYEIEVRGGAPRRATRTANDGQYKSGERALASLLGVGAGRFVVTTANDPVRAELTGSLAEQLAHPIAAARAALAATTGTAMMTVERVSFDEEALDEYLRTTPEPTRKVIQTLARGTPPRQLLLDGEVSPSLVEDVLADLAARGAICAVEGHGRADMLAERFDSALAVLRGKASSRHPPTPPLRPTDRSPVARVVPVEEPEVGPSESAPEEPLDYEALFASPPPPPASPSDADVAPSSLEDAVIRELSDRLAEPLGEFPASQRPPIIQPGELLMRRASDPDIFGDGGPRASVAQPARVSIPPDEVVPGGTSSEEIVVAPLEADATVETPALFASALEPGVAEITPPIRSPLAPPAAAYPSPPPPLAETPVPPPAVNPAPRREQVDTVGPPRRAPTSHWGSLLALGALASAVAAVAWWMTGEPPAPMPAPPPAATSAVLAEPPAPPPPAATSASPAPRTAASDDLPPGAEVPPGYGFVEIRAPTGAAVRLDGKLVGAGPSVSLPAAPGYHELRVQHQGRDTNQVIEVRAAKMTRVRAALAP